MRRSSSRRSSSSAPIVGAGAVSPQAAENSSDAGEEEQLEATAIVDDLQKCRRLVASMRGLVLATALRQQIVRDVEQADGRLAVRKRRAEGDETFVDNGSKLLSLESPRHRYLK